MRSDRDALRTLPDDDRDDGLITSRTLDQYRELVADHVKAFLNGG
jgi:hypothetical protein